MRTSDEIVSKLQAARVRYLEDVAKYRAARDQAESHLRTAEHELAQSLAELFHNPRVTQLSRAG